jgi:hypothetical protein
MVIPRSLIAFTPANLTRSMKATRGLRGSDLVGTACRDEPFEAVEQLASSGIADRPSREGVGEEVRRDMGERMKAKQGGASDQPVGEGSSPASIDLYWLPLGAGGSSLG